MVKQKGGRAKSNKQDLFIVEAFIDRRRRPDGTLELLVKWKDYPSSHNTWEASQNVAHCKEIVNDFREQRLAEGFDDSEYETDFIPSNPPLEVVKSPPKKRRKPVKKDESVSPEPSSSTATVTTTAEVMPPSSDTTLHNTSGEVSLPPIQLRSQPVEIMTETIEGGSTVTQVVSVMRIFSTTVGRHERLFSVLLNNGEKLWFSNTYVRKWLPQLLLDYYESCVVSDVTLSTEGIVDASFVQEPGPSDDNITPVDNQWSVSSPAPSPSHDASIPPAVSHNPSYLNLSRQYSSPQRRQIVQNPIPVNYYSRSYQHSVPMYQQPMPLDFNIRHQPPPQNFRPQLMHQQPLQQHSSPHRLQPSLHSSHQHHLPQHPALPLQQLHLSSQQPQQQHYQPPPQHHATTTEPVSSGSMYDYDQNFDNNEIDWFTHDENPS